MNVILHYAASKFEPILIGAYGPVPEEQTRATLVTLAQKHDPNITGTGLNFIRYKDKHGQIFLLESQPLKPI